METELTCCVYCGDYDESNDHVTPQCYTHIVNDGSGPTVPCCMLCNVLAGAVYVTEIFEKAYYLERRYLIRFARYLQGARWSDEELDELDYTLRSFVQKREYTKRFIHFKLDNLRLVQNGYSPVSIHQLDRDLMNKARAICYTDES